MSENNKPLGIVVYKGPSLIDNKPIIVIATNVFKKRYRNSKIGKMIQFWILREDISPLSATKTGEDYSICGDCKHRHFGSCYVNLIRGPEPIFNAFHKNRYLDFKLPMIEYFDGKSLRIGAYGDPAAVPFEVWNMFCRVSKNNTGYTHLWKSCNQELKTFLMASVDSEKEKDKAQEMGWRTFRIRQHINDSVGSNEFICPASQEEGKKLSCEQCGACGGLLKGSLRNNPCIVIHIHSGGATGFKIKRFIKGMEKIKNKKKWKKEFSLV